MVLTELIRETIGNFVDLVNDKGICSGVAGAGGFK